MKINPWLAVAVFLTIWGIRNRPGLIEILFIAAIWIIYAYKFHAKKEDESNEHNQERKSD